VINAEIQECSSSTVGFIRITALHQELAAAGARSAPPRGRLMRSCPAAAKNRKHSAPCAGSSKRLRATENRCTASRIFQPSAPNRSWAGDITYIRTKALAVPGVWIDLFSRRVVGWKLDSGIRSALVIEAAQRALRYIARFTPRKLADPYGPAAANTGATDIPRSPRRKHEIVCSMPPRLLLDNAVVESFFSTSQNYERILQ